MVLAIILAGPNSGVSLRWLRLCDGAGFGAAFGVLLWCSALTGEGKYKNQVLLQVLILGAANSSNMVKQVCGWFGLAMKNRAGSDLRK